MKLQESIIHIPDFPAKGILFRDLNPLWENKDLFQKLTKEMGAMVTGLSPTRLVALEARGFIIASALAYSLGLGVSLIRKKGKLPGEVYHTKYGNEYTFTGEIEIQKTSLPKGEKVVLVDDILATGKSSVACAQLIEQFQGVELVGAVYVLELTDLNGRALLEPHVPKILSLIQES